MSRLLSVSLLTLGLGLACTGQVEDSVPEPEDTQVEDDRNQPTGCEELEIDFAGEDPPVVGDVWTLLPKCDGNVLVGAVVIQVDPPSAALLDETVLTWAEAGPAEIMLQAGSKKAYLDVEVGEAPE
jgi:hypothetical protein